MIRWLDRARTARTAAALRRTAGSGAAAQARARIARAIERGSLPGIRRWTAVWCRLMAV